MTKKSKYIYDEKKATRAVKFIETFVTFTKGDYAGKPFILEKWQKEKIIKPLFGWVDKNGLRKYRTAYIEIPRKNGKSNLSAAIALYMLFADGEKGAEVISAAADRNQANIVFSIAKQMVLNNKELSSRARVYRNAISLEDKGSYYKSISSESSTAHGMNLSCAIFDEIHAQRDRELWDVVNTSTAARSQPLVIGITTAGFDKQSICYELNQYALKVRDGIIDDPTFLPVIYRAEPNDDYSSEDTWKKANPSFNSIIKKDYLAQQYKKALNTPSYFNTFLRLHLNVWTNSESAFISDSEWQKCNLAPIDLKRLEGRDCFGGLDLSSTRDLTCLTLIFPDPDNNDYFDIVPFIFVPSAKVEQRSGGDGVCYRTWQDQNYIITTEGNVQDYTFLEKKFLELAEKFNIVSCAFDRWNSSQTIINLMSENCTKFSPIGMGYLSQNAPTKFFESLVLDKKINHGGHPVLRWCMSNVIIDEDAAGNIKLSKKKAKDKIDPIAATIMALAEYMNNDSENNDSIYNDRGLVFI